MFLTILQALIKLPKIWGLIQGLIVKATAFFTKQKTEAVSRKVGDAAISTERAKSSQERDDALKKWSEVYKR